MPEEKQKNEAKKLAQDAVMASQPTQSPTMPPTQPAHKPDQRAASAPTQPAQRPLASTPRSNQPVRRPAPAPTGPAKTVARAAALRKIKVVVGMKNGEYGPSARLEFPHHYYVHKLLEITDPTLQKKYKFRYFNNVLVAGNYNDDLLQFLSDGAMRFGAQLEFVKRVKKIVRQPTPPTLPPILSSGPRPPITQPQSVAPPRPQTPQQKPQSPAQDLNKQKSAQGPGPAVKTQQAQKQDPTSPKDSEKKQKKKSLFSLPK